MTKPNYTHIHMLFDRSGSMRGRESDVQGWYDTFITEQKKLPNPCTVSLATFDTEGYDTVIDWSKLEEVPRKFRLQPRSGTPLLDAAARSINDLGRHLSMMDESERPSKVIVIIQTDGEENSSKEWNLDGLRNLVKTQREVYSWDFMFLGADIDAYGAGQSMGFAQNTVANFGNNSRGYHVVACAAAASVMRSRTTGGSVCYSSAEQKDMEATKLADQVPVTTTGATSGTVVVPVSATGTLSITDITSGHMGLDKTPSAVVVS